MNAAGSNLDFYLELGGRVSNDKQHFACSITHSAHLSCQIGHVPLIQVVVTLTPSRHSTKLPLLTKTMSSERMFDTKVNSMTGVFGK